MAKMKAAILVAPGRIVSEQRDGVLKVAVTR